MSAFFTFQEEYGQSIEVPVTKEVMNIGRGSECEVVIDGNDVSRVHARVSLRDKRHIIEDLGSFNGTFVNAVPITEPTEIKHMDVIQIGSSMLVFNDPDALAPSRFDPSATQDGSAANCSFEFMKFVVGRLERNIGEVFKGKDEVIRNIIICLLADGHILIEDAPGLGKSILAQALAKSIQSSYRRIQFTPDMLPSDITGMNIFDEKTRDFKFLPGPIFGNIILADEINRTTPRTQSSLLECMSESAVTIDGCTHKLSKPFFVIATQNPDDYHGTYPLPEPQLDRFLMRLSIGYPSQEAEHEILSTQQKVHPLNDISAVIKAMDIVRCHALVRGIHVAEPVREYIINIAAATRKHPALAGGCSPRAALALQRVSQSLAAYHGREYVIPRDIREMVKPVLAHRLKIKLRYQGEWRNSEIVLDNILESISMENEDKDIL
jgi:MoxR-like ATPase